MTSIRFDIDRKHEIMEAQRDWPRELPRDEGQIGGPITPWLEGPPIGNTLNFFVNPDFVAYLRRKGIPFEEAS
jgi:hypothetical protein